MVHPGDERHLAGVFASRGCVRPRGTWTRHGSAGSPGTRPAPSSTTGRGHRRRAPSASAPRAVFAPGVLSPVVIAERDHPRGVFLDRDPPKPFHVHTVLRTPHGNDWPGAGPAVAGGGGAGGGPRR